MSRTATTTANLKLRSAPSMEAEPPLAFLEPNTELEVLGEENADWLHVRVSGKEGYVGRKYVALGAETKTDGGGLHKAGDLGTRQPGATKVHKGVEEE